MRPGGHEHPHQPRPSDRRRDHLRGAVRRADRPVFRVDYEKVDQILDAAEQSARESFESGAILAADGHLRAVLNLIANWNLNQAREISWTTAPALWEARDLPVARDLLRASLGRAVAATSQLLLLAL